jgi:prepilin-type processing-associated H-X9-DG protein
MVFPYMEQPALWDQWNTQFGVAPSAPAIEGLTCPSNAPDVPGQPWLAYVGNAGWAFSDTTRTSQEQNVESAANGVFFDDNKNLNFGPPDGRELHPRIQMSLAQVTDGASKTLMLSENLHTIYWSYDADISPTGQGYIQPNSTIPDRKHLFGFIWKNQPSQIERINGDKYYDHSPPPDEAKGLMDGFADPAYESYGYPSSAHPGGVNVAFCGGQIDFMAETVSPLIYAQLMTSNSKRSKLVSGGVPDRKLQQPSDDQY